MAALHTFKLLATRCTAAPPPSPSRSPAPPCFRLHGRHRGRHHLKKKTRTLRRLISSPNPDPDPDADPDLYDPEGGEGGGEREERKGLLMRDSGRTLRDLFVSSPKGKGVDGSGGGCEERGATSAAVAGAGGGRGGGGGGWRFIGVRNRLLRRAWRPVLVAIPE